MSTDLRTALVDTCISFNAYLDSVNATPRYTMADYKNAFFQRFVLAIKRTNFSSHNLKAHNISFEIENNRLKSLVFCDYNTFGRIKLVDDLNNELQSINLNNLGISSSVDVDGIISEINNFSIWKHQKFNNRMMA